MGRCASSSRTRHVAGFMLPSVVGTWPPHHAVRKEPASRSHTRLGHLNGTSELRIVELFGVFSPAFQDEHETCATLSLLSLSYPEAFFAMLVSFWRPACSSVSRSPAHAYLLTHPASVEHSGDGEASTDEGLDCGPGGLPLPACGSGYRAVAGVDARPPVGSEAVGHLAEDHGGADFLLTDVVGRRHAAVAEEDEELAAPRLDLALQLAASRMGSGDTEQGIQAALGFGGVGGECAVLQRRSSLADTDGPAQMITEFRRHHAVAAVDGVLNVA